MLPGFHKINPLLLLVQGALRLASFQHLQSSRTQRCQIVSVSQQTRHPPGLFLSDAKAAQILHRSSMLLAASEFPMNFPWNSHDMHWWLKDSNWFWHVLTRHFILRHSCYLSHSVEVAADPRQEFKVEENLVDLLCLLQDVALDRADIGKTSTNSSWTKTGNGKTCPRRNVKWLARQPAIKTWLVWIEKKLTLILWLNVVLHVTYYLTAWRPPRGAKHSVVSSSGT